MPITPRPAYPVNIWEEPPLPAGAFSLGAFTAYLLTDGSVEFFAPSDTIPVGAIEATVRDSGDGTDEIVTPAVGTGRRVVEATSLLFFL
jgi:hypothetical protein